MLEILFRFFNLIFDAIFKSLTLLIVYAPALSIIFFIYYKIIKKAVKDGYKEAKKEIDEEDYQKRQQIKRDMIK